SVPYRGFRPSSSLWTSPLVRTPHSAPPTFPTPPRPGRPLRPTPVPHSAPPGGTDGSLRRRRPRPTWDDVRRRLLPDPPAGLRQQISLHPSPRALTWVETAYSGETGPDFPCGGSKVEYGGAHWSRYGPSSEKGVVRVLFL